MKEIVKVLVTSISFALFHPFGFTSDGSFFCDPLMLLVSTVLVVGYYMISNQFFEDNPVSSQ